MEEIEKNDRTFQYTYSAKQQEELRKIRQKYIPPEENKMEQLRRLDKKSTQRASLACITAGVCGSLIMGIGMCFTMVWTEYFVPGIIIGLLGIAVIAGAYPIYQLSAKKQREKLAPQIIALTEELMREQR